MATGSAMATESPRPAVESSGLIQLTFAARRTIFGMVIHELRHVVQSYHRGNTPGWLTEGIADHIRGKS